MKKENITNFDSFRTDENGTYYYFINEKGEEIWSYDLENLEEYIIGLQIELNYLKEKKESDR